MKIKDININYEREGSSNNKTIVFLHGWGQNIEMMKPLAKAFYDSNDVVIIDLPGFGKSEEPKEALEIKDYADIVHELLDKLEIKKPSLVGHSFGGRVSIYYSSIYDVEKVVLLSSPYKNDMNANSLKNKILRNAKKVPVLKNFEELAKQILGSEDYKNASPMMRKILVNTVNTDLTENAKKIKAPTILIWGTGDSAVSYKTQKELETLIPDAALIEYPGLSHYAYLENLGQTINIIKNFMEN